MGLAADSTVVTAGQTYYFDLSGQGIAGTVNTAMPGSSLKWVPFTYAGEISAYSRKTAGISTAGTVTVSNRTLFIADYNVTTSVSWDTLNGAALVFGKTYTANNADYQLRIPSVGSGSSNEYFSPPTTNEWDTIYQKNNGFIKNHNSIASWGQDSSSIAADPALMGVIRGGINGPNYAGPAYSNTAAASVGFRPVLQANSTDLCAVTLHLNGGHIGGSLETAQIVVGKNASSYSAPGKSEIVRPAGIGGSYFRWNTHADGTGTDYEPGASVPIHETTLYAKWAPVEQYALATGETYYFDLSDETIPGTISIDRFYSGWGSFPGLPDSTLHFVPFTYVGTINGYNIQTPQAVTQTWADANKSDRSLFLSDYNITHTVSWDALNDENLIFGKTYQCNNILYQIRAASMGTGTAGIPTSNEWDMISEKNTTFMKDDYQTSWGQDSAAHALDNRIVRGVGSSGGNLSPDTLGVIFGFRPILQISSAGLGLNDLKVITVNLGSGGVGPVTGSIKLVVKAGSAYTAPGSTGITRPSAGEYFMWKGSDNLLYAPGASVPADVTSLTAVFTESVGPSITTASLPSGTVNTPYSQTLTATGDTPITWSIQSGALPNGLSLSGNTISGTPTIAGEFSFTVKAANGTLPDATNAFTITVNAAPSKTVTVSGPSDPAIEGTACIVLYNVTTANITDGSAIALNNPDSVAGVTLDSAVTAGNSTKITIRTTAETPPGAHPLTLTIDGATSNVFYLYVEKATDLQSITAPAAITGLANGSAKTASALGLPTTVTIVTGLGNMSINVDWDVDASPYDPSLTTEQTFTIGGTVTLPGGVINPNGVSLNVTVSVTVLAATSADKTLVSVTSPAPITGAANGTAKTASALGLPNLVTLVTDGGDVSANVDWDVDASAYDPSLTAEQTFTIGGTVTLPGGVINPNGVSLDVTVSITVLAATSADKTLVSVTSPAPITGVANGTAKTASALGLPTLVTLVTDGGNVSADVDWDVDASAYDPSITAEQTFTIGGTVTLPSGVINPNGVSLDVTVSVTVLAASTPPVITTTTLPNGSMGMTYSQILAATGDTPIAWTIDSGNLPDGLTLSNGGVISGIPKATGTFNFTIRAMNSTGSDTKTLRILISSTAPVNQTITAAAGSGGSISPVGAVSVLEGGSQTFTITANDGYSISSVTVDGINHGNISLYTFTNVSGNHTIHVEFQYTGTGSDDDYTLRTLTDSATGITASGYISAGAVLTVGNMTLGSDAVCNTIRSWINDEDYALLLGVDISLSGSFTGPLTITLPVGTQYNGEKVTILHAKRESILETCTATVRNGKVTFDVTNLSPFAVFTRDGQDDIPKTRDTSSAWIWWALLAVSGAGIITLVLFKKKAFQKR